MVTSPTHLLPNGSEFVSVPGEETPDGPQLLRAVLDVPDLIVKVSAIERPKEIKQLVNKLERAGD